VQVSAPPAKAPAGASSSSTLADLPPSSRKIFFTVAEASSITRRPVAVEPVKVTMSTRGSEASSSPSRCSEDATMLTTPGGISVFSATRRPIAVALHGVSGAGFSTMVQPAASAGPSLVRFR